MEVDIRFPIGGMFSILGLLLLVFGLITGNDPEMYDRSLELNVNLWTGGAMIIFGGLMLFFSFRALRRKST
jgi:formate hydrogenlyase subunit 3/multisubunit Na+/H+ antiporter MnhD subunit